MINKQEARFVSIYDGVEPYLDSLCRLFGKNFHHITAADLKQECAIKLWLLLDSERRSRVRLTDTELTLVFKRAARNLLTDIWRSHRRAVMLVSVNTLPGGHEDDEENSIFIDTSFDVVEETLFRQYLALIRQNLASELERQIFEVVVAPDPLLIQIVLGDHTTSAQRKRAGELVTNLNEVRVRGKHLAERFAISPATASRVLAGLRKRIATVLHRVQ